jgi:hypothetical protein
VVGSLRFGTCFFAFWAGSSATLFLWDLVSGDGDLIWVGLGGGRGLEGDAFCWDGYLREFEGFGDLDVHEKILGFGGLGVWGFVPSSSL